MKYYVYGHYIPESETPFYIGKGHSKRAWDVRNRNFWWNNIVNKYGLEVKVLYENLTEDEAFSIEKQLITEFGRRDKDSGCLVNLTDGGEGSSGLIYTEEIKKAIYNDKWRQGVLRGAEKRKNDPIWRENKIKSCKELAKRKDWREKMKQVSKDPVRIEKQKISMDKYKKEVTLISPTGEIVHVRGIKEFARSHGLYPSTLCNVISGTQKSHKGWKKYNPPTENRY